MMPPSRNRFLLFAALLVGMVFLAYMPALAAGFIWDDDLCITQNPYLRSVAGLESIWFRVGSVPQYYPLVYTVFWIEYHLWGLNALGFHAVNVALHALAAVLVWRVLARLRVPGAWWAAAVFALHPVNVESVAWVTECKNVLSAVLYLSAFLVYLRVALPEEVEWHGQRPTGVGRVFVGPWLFPYFISLVLFLLALLAKTVTASLPAAILLIIWWNRGRIRWRDVLPLAPFFAAGLAMGRLTAYVEVHDIGAQGPAWNFSFIDRCLIAGRALWFYAGKLFWPTSLTFIYPRWVIDGGVPWQYLFPLAAVALVIAAFVLRKRFGRAPVVALLFFGGTLVPALGFVNIYPMRFSFVADHFQYLASLGLIVLAVGGLAWWTRKRPDILWTCGTMVLVVLGSLTWQQALIYRDLETLWRDTLAKNPDCAMAHNNLALILLGRGDTTQARAEFQDMVRLAPGDAEGHYNLANILADANDLSGATAQYEQALDCDGDDAQVHHNLGSVLVRRGDVDGAIKHFERALAIKPEYPLARYHLALAWAIQGRTNEAVAGCRQAANESWDDPGLLAQIGQSLAKLNQLDDAVRDLQRSLALRPNSAETHNALGEALLAQGLPGRAMVEFADAVQIDPEFVKARENLARVMARGQ